MITNKPIDVFSQYKFANPSVFGSSFYLFRNRYFDMTGYGKYTPVMKQAMETEFTQRLHSIAFRATKAECLDLPDTTDVIQRVDLEPAALRAYRQLVKDSYTELQDGAVTITNVLTRLLRLSQLTGGFLGSDEDPRPEQVSSLLDALEEILESVDGQKLVIIARFLPEIRAIEQLLTRKGIRYAIIHGGLNNRAAQVSAFQRCDSAPIPRSHPPAERCPLPACRASRHRWPRMASNGPRPSLRISTCWPALNTCSWCKRLGLGGHG